MSLNVKEFMIKVAKYNTNKKKLLKNKKITMGFKHFYFLEY
jgi:hypothetical protein